MTLLQIRLLGEFEATDHRGNSLSIGNKRTQAMLVYLALHVDGGGSLREIGDLLFAGTDNVALARELLRDLQYSLRFLPGDLLVESSDSLKLNPEAVHVDVHEFVELSESPAIAKLRQAADLYRGNLLDAWSSGVPSFDSWLAERRVTYWRTAVAALGRLLAAQIRAGWWERASETASQLLALDPTQEVVHRTLMRLQLEQGRPDAALRRYQECADILQREFSREPSPETRRVRDEIVTALAGTPAIREITRTRDVDTPQLVLVVEDDVVSAALVEGYLTEAGFEVVTVHDGADALMEIAKRNFDLLILDINIPTLNGLRLFEIMIQKGIDTPAIFITGIPGTEVEARSLEAGAADFLRKPVRREVLIPRIRHILERKQRDSRNHGGN